MNVVNTTTGEVLPDHEFKRQHSNTSFPAILSRQILEDFGFDIVVETDKPEYTDRQVVTPGPVELINDEYRQTWMIEDLVFTPEEEAEMLNNRRVALKEELASIRYQHEVGGITFNGQRISTDREDQAMLNSAYVATQIDTSRTISWKSESGWVEMNAETIASLAEAVINHVQGCFNKEKELSMALDIDINTDIHAGWN